MVMEAAPVAAFVMTQSYLLLKFLIVALDPPAQLRQADHLFERDVFRQIGKPVFDGFGLGRRPLDDEPLLRSYLVAVSDPYAHASKARTQRAALSFAPRDRLPLPSGQHVREGLHIRGLTFGIALPARAGAAFAAVLRRQGLITLSPHRRLVLDAHGVT